MGFKIENYETKTADIKAEVEETIVQARFRQEKKIEILEKILRQHFDFDTLNQGLGLA